MSSSPESSALAAYESAVLRVCYDRRASDADLASLDGSGERWLLYRRMVRRRLTRMIRDALPQSFKLMGDEGTEAVVAFLASYGTRSRFIRDCVLEFAEHRLEAPTTPELAWMLRLESAKWACRHAMDDVGDAPELSLEAVLSFSISSQFISVQRAGAPPRAAVVSRNASHRVTVRKLTALETALVRAWVAGGAAASAASRSVARELGVEVDAAFVEVMATLLTDLVDAGAVRALDP